MKKTICFILAALGVMSMTACSGRNVRTDDTSDGFIGRTVDEARDMVGDTVQDIENDLDMTTDRSRSYTGQNGSTGVGRGEGWENRVADAEYGTGARNGTDTNRTAGNSGTSR